MSKFGKAASKFRAASGKASADVYNELRVPELSTHSMGISASALYAAAPFGDGGSGNVVVVPIDHSKFARSSQPPLITAHGDPLSDLQFSPYHDDLLATCSGDGTVKLWQIPEGGLTNSLSDPILKLSGIEGGCQSLKFHPAASHLLAVGAKHGLHIADLEKGVVSHSFGVKSNGRDIMSVDWSFDGTQACAVGKDAAVHVFDPRSAAQDVLESSGKRDIKVQRCLYVGSLSNPMLAVIGADKMRSPVLEFFDTKNLEKPLFTTRPNFSTGTILSMYDVDTELLFLAVRGSTDVYMFDLFPGVHMDLLSSAGTKTRFLGACLVPKSVVNTDVCEVQRVLKVSPNAIEPISITVARKIKGFHDDLYPPTASDKAPLSAATWLEGKNASPVLTGVLRLQESKGKIKKVEEKKDDGPVKTVSPAPGSSSGPSPSPREGQKATLPVVKTATRAKIESIVKRSLFAHLSGTEPNSVEAQLYDIAADPCIALNKNLRMNSALMAFPCKALGGSAIGVVPVNRVSRFGSYPLVRGHKSQITAFDLSPHNTSLLASGGSEAHILVQKVPEGEMKEELSDVYASFKGAGKITTCEFHPYVSNLLVTSSVGFDGSSVHLWDVEHQKEGAHLQLHKEPVVDITYSYDATLLASTSRDRCVRIIDPRAGTVAEQWELPEGRRDPRALWLGNTGRMVTLGFAEFSRRTISVWDLKNTKAPLCTHMLDTANSTMIPYLDADISVLYVGSSGSRMIQLFEVSGEGITVLGSHRTTHDLLGMAFAPSKTNLNIKDVEVARAAMLSKSILVPCSFSVPRKRLDFFQDDIFPPTRSPAPLLSAADWLAGNNAEVKMVNLCPQGMTPLSQAPAEDLTEREKKYVKHVQETAKPRPTNFMGHTTADETRKHFERAKDNMPRGNRWDARPEEPEPIDPSEWD